MLTRSADGVDRLQALLRFHVQSAVVAQEVGVAKDGSERRANLMAHVRQELTFGVVRRIGGDTCLDERFFILLPLRDVNEDTAKNRR